MFSVFTAMPDSILIIFLLLFSTGCEIASHADALDLRLVTSLPTRGGTRDKPKNVCVGG